MKHDILALKNCPLFIGVKESDLPTLLEYLNAQVQTFMKTETILFAGGVPKYMGILLSGRAHIIQEDFWGNRMILASLEPEEMFAESVVCAQSNHVLVSVVAQEQCRVLLIDGNRLLSCEATSPAFFAGLIPNLLTILAHKNLMLTRKMGHITKKTTREKLLSYLSDYAVQTGNESFEIPFNRQELADYLSVERSALSNVLSKLKEEGLLLYHKNSFTLFHNQNSTGLHT